MSVQDNLAKIRGRIAAAAARAGRDPGGVEVVGAAKLQAAGALREAAGAGLRVLGENKLQEARGHRAALAGLEVAWHFIGHLQRNKAREVVGAFALLHSLDSLRLAEKLEQEAEKKGVRVAALLQLNISAEGSKGGFAEGELKETLAALGGLGRVELKGLMTMPPFFDDPEGARPYFRRLRELRDAANAGNWYREPLEHLSMGMSGDFETAVEEGATFIRLGTILFGERA